jgi:hypothetical protein
MVSCFVRLFGSQLIHIRIHRGINGSVQVKSDGSQDETLKTSTALPSNSWRKSALRCHQLAAGVQLSAFALACNLLHLLPPIMRCQWAMDRALHASNNPQRPIQSPLGANPLQDLIPRPPISSLHLCCCCCPRRQQQRAVCRSREIGQSSPALRDKREKVRWAAALQLVEDCVQWKRKRKALFGEGESGGKGLKGRRATRHNNRSEAVSAAAADTSSRRLHPRQQLPIPPPRRKQPP